MAPFSSDASAGESPATVGGGAVGGGSASTVHRIAVLPGDGVGPEVVAEAVKVLRAAEHREAGLSLELTEHAVGAGAYLKLGDPLPPATFEACRSADAILLGAMGLPDVRWPDGREMAPQIDLREKLELYCGLRPIRLYHRDDTPLKHVRQIDFALIRENTEGLFSTRERYTDDRDTARDELLVTRRASERLFHAAFKEAQRRQGRLTLVDKANVLPSMVLFRAIFDEVAKQYPDVETDRVYVDAMALYLVQRPERFDVMVTENMFGDILSDLAAGLVGGMGMAPSGDIGDRHAVFQPSHGTAPDIAGQGKANPIATIVSAAMMLDWLGSPPARAAGQRIDAAVNQVLADPANRTPDVRGTLTTTDLGDLVAQAVLTG